MSSFTLNNVYLRSRYTVASKKEKEGPLKDYIDYFYNDPQFNAIYNFWLSHKLENETFYDWAKPSLDHIIPSSKGGTNTLDNFQFLTTFENLAKRDMTMTEWENFKQKTNTTSSYFIENIMKAREGL